ncbi:MAG: DUF3987 domain-containing protein [Vibrionaceae bacterium]
MIAQDADLISIAAASPLAFFADELAAAAKMPRNTTFLTVMSIFSALCCRAYSVRYQHNTGEQPTSLYFCGEQPPAAAKSRILKEAQSPVFALTKARRRELLEEKQHADEDRQAEIDIEIRALLEYITDTTPEALDASLPHTNGFFAITSAEQGSINSLLGMSYKSNDSDPNKDLALKGYNGEWHKSMRVSRKTYSGAVVGALCVIAQEGMISKIIDASNGSGAAERLIMWSEAHLLGQRDFLNNDYYQSNESKAAYFNAAENVYNKIKSLPDFAELEALHISDRAWFEIKKLRQHYEPTLANGGANSTNLLRGVIGKIDILIMKLASVLHLSIDPDNPIIDDARVKEAILIAQAYIAHLKGLIGESTIETNSTQDNEVLALLNDGRAYSMEFIASKLRRKKAFIVNGKTNKALVKDTVSALAVRQLITATIIDGQLCYKARRIIK